MVVRLTLLIAAFLLPSAALLSSTPQSRRAGRQQAVVAPITFEKHVRPLIAKYCIACHTGKTGQGGITLSPYRTAAQVLKARNHWEKVSVNVSAGNMPPPHAPQPSQKERELISGWIDSTLSQADCALEDPGRVTMRRLNRVEYNNTIRDLVGLDLKPADSFPSDDVGYGFDNIGDVLSISPILMEKYLSAAEKVAEAAITLPGAAPAATRYEAEKPPNVEGTFANTNNRILASNAEVGVEHEFKVGGEYALRVRAFGQQAGPEVVRMGLRLDGQELKTEEVRGSQEQPQIFELKIPIKAGKRRFAAAFLNDYYNPTAQGGGRDRNLILDYLEIQGPFGAALELPESHRRIFRGLKPSAGNEKETARRILTEFARRAYRRPVSKAEAERLLRYVDFAKKLGEPFERGIQLAVQAVLVSPHFLFKVEIDPNPNDPKSRRLLNDFELATRLSYFLWSSMPDETLFDLAAKGKLKDSTVLLAQAKRMLKDPKARALAENFGGQWLTLRSLNNFSPDPKLFPAWNDSLRSAMRAETERYFEAIAREDRSILEFIDSNYTFLNEALANHYGIPGVKGDEFRRVNFVSRSRGGVLTHASILSVTSNPTRTSPVKRGKWVLEQLLGTPPPPPPPGAGELKEEGEALKGTLRQRMEQHRNDAGCASCHSRMDPIGFGLENFDAIGAWRDKEGSEPVDASGTLPGGKPFKGPGELKQILLAKKNLFVRNLCEKLLTYAIGRGVESTDKCNIDDMAKSVVAKGYRFSALVNAVIQSEPFRKRRGDIAKQRS